jgi:hypothetical protein
LVMDDCLNLYDARYWDRTVSRTLQRWYRK